MALRRLAKDPGSANGGCPTVYADDTPLDHQALVLQGNVVERAHPGTAQARDTAAWRSPDDATVMVQGQPLAAERVSELENVLPDEDAVPVSRDVLFDAVAGGTPLPALVPGQVRLTIKSSIVDAARSAADHPEAP